MNSDMKLAWQLLNMTLNMKHTKSITKMHRYTKVKTYNMNAYARKEWGRTIEI